jgi:membrane protease YdiL (CAAX protease family)
MDKERLQASDYRFIAICVALAAVTVWFSVNNFHRAFPEASIDFKVNRADAQELAGKFLVTQGYRLADYHQAARFDYDDDAKTFLERELGLEQANRLMGTRVRLWRWSYRWFKPLQKEEYTVDITPRGELAGFEHEIAEDAARPEASEAQARALAEDFLRRRMGRDPASLEFVEASNVTRPHRVDRTFTWKEREFQPHDATYRLGVTVLGNEVGGYREYLKVPDQWKRDYERLRSKNQLAATIDSAFMVLLMVAMVVVIVLRVRRHDVRWRRAAMVGVAGIVLAFLAQLNEFPLHEFDFPTTDPYSTFLSRQALMAVITALGWGGFLFVIAAGAEPLYREAYGSRISLGSLFTLRGLRTKKFFLGTILGLTLTGVFIAYQTAFYIVAYRLGAWSPADVPYTDLLNTKFPWAFVLFGGFMPAVFEEFVFRMFAIPFLRTLTRSIAGAVVLAGFIWGFGHASYPQQPFWIRGVEVGIGGVALGIIMLRFGILPTLVWHYSVDAMYSAMLLVRSESLYYKLSGAAAAGIMVLPVAAALVAYLVKGGFEPDTALLNRDEEQPAEVPLAEPEAAAASEIAYQPLSPARRWAAVGLLVVGAVTMLHPPLSRFGDQPAYKITAEQARASSDAFLKEQGLDPGAFQHVTYPAVRWGGGDELAGKYFLQRKTLADASMLFEKYRAVHHWMTRYFKSLDKEELNVSVHPETARVMSFTHEVPEDRAGADLPAERALAIATTFATSRGWDVGAMELKENRSEKQKARRDYTYQWEARAGDPRNVGETRFRVLVEVSGDQVTQGRSFWKVPEAFERAQDRSTAISIAMLVIRIAAISGLIVYALWTLIQGTRRGVVRWRAAIKLAVPATLLFPVGPLLSASLLLKGYPTSIPLETYQVMSYLIITMSVIFGFLVMGGAAALITTFYPEAVPSLRGENRQAMGLDALLTVLAGVGMALLVAHIRARLVEGFHAQAVLDIGAPDIIVSLAPAVAAVAGAVRSLLSDGAALALIGLVIYQVRKPWILVVAGLLAVAVMMPGDVRTPGEVALYYPLALLSAAGGLGLCWFFARRNYLAYALLVWMLALRGPMMELFGNGNSALNMWGWVIAAVMALTAVWAAAPAVMARKGAHQAANNAA